ncbi:hypothetical protein ADUPG1_005621 [Aduncisulcus paluster]|uniref:Secreted protein n=1 Tax=Aduncisulcus paluster TaxID=2918883 RepID=A0ABQ5KGY0_9EUKA|nr:hypothetical protein ADUPG1_005621 [Aduncisulcus paluster]
MSSNNSSHDSSPPAHLIACFTRAVCYFVCCVCCSESSWGEFEAHSPSLEAERSSLPSSSHPLTPILDRAKVFFLRWMWVVQKEEKTSVKEGRKLCRVGE